MRPLVLGLGLLVLCLVLCLTATLLLNRFTDHAAAALETARKLAADGDYPAAAAQVRAAWRYWEARRGFFGVVLRHAEADGVHGSFRRLLAYGENAVAQEFAPACAELIAEIRHLAEAERPYYYNVW